MARILTDESTLTKKRRSLSRESNILKIIGILEALLAALLLIGGIAALILKGTYGVLIIGAVAAFLAVGHIVKIRENRQEHGFVSAGLRGEVEVTGVLKETLDDETYILNDVLIRHGWHSAQIDHLVVGPNGIFVIETKNWRGTITGDENEPKWRQVKNSAKEPVHVSNPIRQNERHVQILQKWLGDKGVHPGEIHSVIVMTSPRSSWTIQNRTVPILRPDEIGDYIKGFRPDAVPEPAQIDRITSLLVAEK